MAFRKSLAALFGVERRFFLLNNFLIPLDLTRNLDNNSMFIALMNSTQFFGSQEE